MERSRLRLGGTLLLCAAAVTFGAAGAVLYSHAAPYVGILDLARAVAPGLALAAAAGVVSVLGRGGAAPFLLIAASVSTSAPAFGVGVQQHTPAWVAIASLGALLAPLLVVTALGYPTGRLPGRRVRAVAGVVLVVGAAAAFVNATSYDPEAWGWCECVANPLAGSVEADTYLARAELIVVAEMVVLLVGLVALAVMGGWRQRSRLPFTATYGVLALSWLASDAWVVSRGPDVPEAWEVARDCALVLVPVAYLLGFVAQRPSRAHVADLLLAAREEHHPGRLRDLVSRAIGDPAARVAWWDPRTQGYLDHRGHDVGVPDDGAIRVEAAGRPIAVVMSDRLGDVDVGVRDSVAEALLLAAENRRLAAELQASLEQVRDSRARILTASDDTRRRIERDLHDGAQQLLISTGIKLNLAAAQAERGDAETLARVLEEAQTELNRALSDIRNLASGIAPTALVHGTLDNALRELALASPITTSVRVTGADQPDEHTAATVYFVVAECLANVAKHARASRAGVDVHLGDTVELRVTDDGVGGATLDSPGTGLRGLVDRVEARGGSLQVASGPEGTTVEATFPRTVAEVAEAAEVGER